MRLMATRLGVVALLLALLNACASSRAIRLDTGQGAPLEYSSSSSSLMAVDSAPFEEALSRLVLEMPLPLRPPHQGWLVRTASHSKPWEVEKGLGEWDRLGIALALSLEPLKESIARAVEGTLAPQLFYSVIATGLVTWAVLAANPEPLFTKAAAITSAVLLIYLGVDTFLEVVDASRELKAATDRATTWMELNQAGHRFANRVGPEVARVLVLAVTVVVSHGMTGGAAYLASRMSMLPGFVDAAALGASQVGINLASVGQVSAVAIEGSTIIISLPATAVAMAAHGTRGTSTRGTPAGGKSWGSFSGFKSALGAAGPGKQWHHIVEQTPGNVERFGPHSLHNTQNVIPLDAAIHKEVSRIYSSIRPGITNSRTLTVRRWLSAQSYEAQRAFGLRTIDNVTKGIW
ncbi:hypothetical protein MFUL124B02_28905 [Myxococcus fulvus 124B02]|nr:hypothetical protein MFUL124B02_28905 [Myxococcus fulvus 124B02]